MPAPLIWLGAAVLGLYASDKANIAYLKQKNIVKGMPGDQSDKVEPADGSVVCCGVYGVLDHTGIWVDGNIYELNGNGLVRCISPSRFLDNRTGSTIYVACNDYGVALANTTASNRAQSHLYSLFDYHLIRQNCHRFVAEMIAGICIDITSFSELNTFLNKHYDERISWLPADYPLR
ncbi:hypothetical protein [Glaciecola sp. 1036]|uniref:hypothetical protein n=1 Tax=Alteromonadaceae TaxID=72275 RepID=UPI003CFBFAE9